MLDARTRSVVKPGIEVVAQLESVMLVMKVEAWVKVKSLVVKVEVMALVMEMTTSARVLTMQVGDVGLEVMWYIASYCLLYSLLHYLITLQCTALQCVLLSTL